VQEQLALHHQEPMAEQVETALQHQSLDHQSLMLVAVAVHLIPEAKEQRVQVVQQLDNMTAQQMQQQTQAAAQVAEIEQVAQQATADLV
jgi:hypothetical protein